MQDFSYVASLLNGASYNDTTMFTSVQPKLASMLRDEIFDEILRSFENKPINVFQVGAIESMTNEYRIGSGWADIFWGNYIKKNGGELVVVDININHIANSHFLAETLKYPIRLHIGDAAGVISEGFDIYYLDGADIAYARDAYEQTLQQFRTIENTKSMVLVDDIHTKAVHLSRYVRHKAESRNWVVKEYSYGNGMMTIDMRNQNFESTVESSEGS